MSKIEDIRARYAYKESFDPLLNPYISKLWDRGELIHDLKDVSKIFSKKNYNILELGCGNGHFLQNYLDLKPGSKALGIDKRFKRLYKTSKKLAELGGHVYHGDVTEFVSRTRSALWDEIWVQFPDPWPKERHKKNRMLNPIFFHQVYRLLKNKGRFCFISDSKLYWDFLIRANQRSQLFSASICLEGDLFSELPPTLFKKRFLALKRPIYSIEFRKHVLNKENVFQELEN